MEEAHSGTAEGRFGKEVHYSEIEEVHSEIEGVHPDIEAGHFEIEVVHCGIVEALVEIEVAHSGIEVGRSGTNHLAAGIAEVVQNLGCSGTEAAQQD